MINQLPQPEAYQPNQHSESSSSLLAEVIPMGARSGDIINLVAQESFPDPVDAAAFKLRILRPTTETEAGRVDALPHQPGRLDAMTYVDYSASGAVVVNPGDSPKFLTTSKLNGCTTTVLYHKYADGSAEAAMTHYAPMAVERQKAELAQQVSAVKDGLASQSLYILAASSAGDELAQYIKETVSADLPVTQRLYNRNDEKPDDYGAVVVVVEAGDQVSTVHTWLGAGEIL